MFLDHFLNVEHELRCTVPKWLYHYCKARSLQYFVRHDSDIWCTHCNHLNDPEECWFGMRLFLDYLKQRDSGSEKVYQALEYNVRNKSLWHKIFSKDGHSRIMPFTFSFSEAGGEPTLWEYAGNLGYKIEFDGAGIELNAGHVSSVLSTLDPSSRMTLSLWPCFYKESNAKEIGSLFDALYQDLRSTILAIGNDVGDVVAGRIFLSTLACVAPLFKAEKWSYEREWRLIMVRENFDRVQFVNHRARSYMSSAPGGVRGLIKRITSCPSGNVDWENKYLQFQINDGFRQVGGKEEVCI